MKYTGNRFVNLILGVAALALLGTASASAQEQPQGLALMGIGNVKVTPALTEAARRAGTANSLGRVVQAMDGQLIDRMHNTRKFTLVTESDLKDVLKEQEKQGSGNYSDSAMADACKLKGCQYLLITSVDNFQDYVEKQNFEALGMSASRRTVHFSVVAKIFNVTTGTVLETANLALNTTGGELNEDLLSNIARSMSQRVADRVIDVIYPAKIIAVTGGNVTINRGDGTNIGVGEVWDVFSLGKEMKDPDTGASLGQEETHVGKIRITEIDPKFSKGAIIDGTGIDRGMIARPVLAPAGPPGPQQGQPGGQ